jgi:CubicO group peptidase (beta-lactamase class C family)
VPPLASNGADDRFVLGPDYADEYDPPLHAESGMGYGIFVRLDRCNFYQEVSAAAFGHPSNAGTWGMCDPDVGLVICLRINAAPRELIADGGAYRSAHGHPVIAAVYNAYR